MRTTVRRVGAIVLAAGALALAGCSGTADGPHEVTGKDYQGSYCLTTMVYNGKTSVPVVNCYPDRWTLVLDEGSLDTDPSTFDSIEVGDVVQVRDGGVVK